MSMLKIRNFLRKLRRNVFAYYATEATAILLINIIGVLLSLSLISNVHFFNPVARALESFDITDIYYDIMRNDEPDTCSVITLVDITPLYDRGQIAMVLDEIHELNPAVIGIDVCFEGIKDDPVGSEVLSSVVQACPEVVYAYKLEDYNPITKHFDREVHSFFTKECHVNEGFVNTNASKSGEMERSLTMRQDFDGKKSYHLTAIVAGKFLGTGVSKWKNRDQCNIDYTPTVFRRIMYSDIEKHPEYITGHVVLLGGVSDRSDTHFTPMGKLPGIEIWAYAINTLLQSNQVKALQGFWYYVVTFLFSWIITFLYCWYQRRSMRVRSSVISYIMTMTLTINILISILVTLMVAFGYYVFHNWNVDLRMGLSISLVLLMISAYSVYELLKTVVKRILYNMDKKK